MQPCVICWQGCRSLYWGVQDRPKQISVAIADWPMGQHSARARSIIEGGLLHCAASRLLWNAAVQLLLLLCRPEEAINSRVSLRLC